MKKNKYIIIYGDGGSAHPFKSIREAKRYVESEWFSGKEATIYRLMPTLWTKKTEEYGKRKRIWRKP